MGRLLELGRRVALQPMDAHCHDITVALYEDRDGAGRPVFRFHSYSARPDAPARLAFLARAALALGGMAAVPDRPHSVRWPCGAGHPAATRRLFAEVVKLAGPELPPARPAEIREAKSGILFRVAPLGGGRFALAAEGPGETGARLRALAQGFSKLAETDAEEGAAPVIRFPCGAEHAALLALLLPRALNVRAAMREEEAVAARGVLVAPSAQSGAGAGGS